MEYRYCIDCNQLKEIKFFKGDKPRCRLCELKNIELKMLKFKMNQLDISVLGSNNEEEITVMGKYFECSYKVDLKTAKEMVKKGRALVYSSDTIYKLFSKMDKDLDYFEKEKILVRNNFICQSCGDFGNNVRTLLNEVLNEKVHICICDNCKNKKNIQGIAIIFKYKFNLEHMPTFVETLPLSISDKQIKCYDKNGDPLDEMPIELLKRYIQEGSCKVIKELPNVVVFLYSTQFKGLKEFILKRDNYTCYYCGEYGDTVDHLVPKSRGGLNTPKNLVCSCKKCNEEKGDMTKEEYEIYKRKQIRKFLNKSDNFQNYIDDKVN